MMQDIADGRSCDSPACSWNRNAGRGTLHSSLCQNPHFFQLLHLCASFSVSVTSSLLQLKLEEKERERTSLCKSREYVCSSTVCDAIISASPSFQGSFVPFYNNRTHWFEDILVFSSAIPKNSHTEAEGRKKQMRKVKSGFSMSRGAGEGARVLRSQIIMRVRNL